MNTPLRLVPRVRSSAAAIGLLMISLLAAPVVRATTYTWSGAAGNGFTNAGNWQGGVAPASDLVNTDLAFGLATSYAPALAGNFNVHSLVLSSGAYTFNNAALIVGAGGLTHNSTSAQTFNTGVALGADQTWTLAGGAGALTFGNSLNTSIPFSPARTLTINAATTTGSGNVLNGAITGGGALTKTGAGILTLTGASTFTGAATVSAGTLAVTGSLSGTGGLSTTNGANLSISNGKVTLGTGLPFTLDGTAASPATGSLAGKDGALSTGDAYVGVSGVASFTQTAGSFTTNGGELYVGYNLLANGTYSLSGPGTLTAGRISVGDAGTGLFTQSAGTVTSSDLFILAEYPNSHGTYQLSGTGTLSVKGVYLGLDGSGTLNQSGGQVTATDTISIGYTSGSNGLYLLTGDSSTLSAQEVYVGDGSTGRFDQKGGTVTTNGHDLHVGSGPNCTGTYLLDGANSVVSTASLRVGEQGTGTFTQTAGTVATATTDGYLYMGGNARGNGTYNLNGGTLTMARSQIGNEASTAVFNQNGGTHTTPILSLTGNSTSSIGTYHLNGGALVTGIVQAGNNGVSGTSTFNFNGGTLRASAGNDSFLRDLTTTKVQAGGAVVDTNGFNVRINQTLLHDSSLTGKDGGLTKNGPGRLVVTGNNTFTGDTNINGGTLFGSGLVNFQLTAYSFGTGSVRVNSGGTLDGIGLIAGSLFVNSGGTMVGPYDISGNLTVAGGGLVTIPAMAPVKVTGNVINNGTIRLTQGASLTVGAGSTFVNNGTLDIISGSISAPGGFTNNGTVLDSTTVKVKTFAFDRVNNAATVTIDGYTGHTYQLWSTPDLAATRFAAVPNVPILSGTTGQALTFIDPAATGSQRFYRVVVDP